MNATMQCACGRHPLQCIIPPYLLERLADGSNAKLRRSAIEAIESSADARAMRRVMQAMPAMAGYRMRSVTGSTSSSQPTCSSTSSVLMCCSNRYTAASRPGAR